MLLLQVNLQPAGAASQPRGNLLGLLFGLDLDVQPIQVLGGAFALDISDNLDGSLNVAWGVPKQVPDSYNVYVNGALYQNVMVPRVLVTGLPGITCNIKVVQVINGTEVGPQTDRTVTPSPTSVMLVTPMKRVFPFPNSGLD